MDIIDHEHAAVTPLAGERHGDLARPDKAMRVHVGMDTPRAVWQAAERASRPGDVEVIVDATGSVATRLSLGYGTGSRPASPDPAYRYGLIVELAHVVLSAAAREVIDEVIGAGA